MTALHGFLGRPDDWDGLLPDSAQRPDWLPLFGREVSRAPDLHPLPLPHAAHEEGVPDVANLLNSGPGGDLVGYSMGGRIGLHMILQAPGLWRRAVVVSASPGLANPAERESRFVSDRRWAERFRSEPWGDVIEAWNAQSVFAADPPDRTPRSETDYDREALARALESGSVGLQHDLREPLRQTETRILWLAGEKDPKYAALAQECAALNPRFSAKIVPNAGHRVLWGNPAEVRDALNAFLTE